MAFIDNKKPVIAYLYAPDGTALFTVPPQMDDTDKLAVSLYGKVTAAGDTPLITNATYGLAASPTAENLSGGDGFSDTIWWPMSENGRQMQFPTYPYVFNGTTWDRPRTIAASGGGLGVQKVGTLGELITLAASAARTTGANGTAVSGVGWRKRYLVLLDVTAAATNVGDTLDVYVDGSLDNSTYVNIGHFTQVLGNGGAKKFFMVLDGGSPGATDIAVTADAAAGAVRAAMAGLPFMRARWAIADGGGGVQSFTFSVTAWAI